MKSKYHFDSKDPYCLARHSLHGICNSSEITPTPAAPAKPFEISYGHGNWPDSRIFLMKDTLDDEEVDDYCENERFVLGVERIIRKIKGHDKINEIGQEEWKEIFRVWKRGQNRCDPTTRTFPLLRNELEAPEAELEKQFRSAGNRMLETISLSWGRAYNQDKVYMPEPAPIAQQKGQQESAQGGHNGREQEKDEQMRMPQPIEPPWPPLKTLGSTTKPDNVWVPYIALLKDNP